MYVCIDSGMMYVQYPVEMREPKMGDADQRTNGGKAPVYPHCPVFAPYRSRPQCDAIDDTCIKKPPTTPRSLRTDYYS